MGLLNLLFGNNTFKENHGESIDDDCDEKELKACYEWSEFYPDNCDDSFVEKIIKANSKIVIDDNMKSRDVAICLGELDNANHREKVFNDLCNDGFVITSSFINELGYNIGDCPLYRQVLDMFTGPFPIETIMKILYEEGDDAEISDFEYYFAHREGKFNYKQVMEFNECFPDMSNVIREDLLADIRDSIAFNQVAEVLEVMPELSKSAKQLLIMDIKGKPKYSELESILECLDKESYGLMAGYVSQLKKDDQIELRDTYRF